MSLEQADRGTLAGGVESGGVGNTFEADHRVGLRVVGTFPVQHILHRWVDGVEVEGFNPRLPYSTRGCYCAEPDGIFVKRYSLT